MGPLLSLGMLTAAARHWSDGALNDRYEIRRPEPIAAFLADVADRRGPIVLLCSDYVWNIARNMEVAREVKATHPDLVVVHGGPSVPKHDEDAARFLDDHGDVADVLVRGEGETVLCELLDAIADDLPALDRGRLAELEGICFRAEDGTVVQTPEHGRIMELDLLPSPYLTGEFDDIGTEDWGGQPLYVESNRGCPYGCTYCDWGSATLSRIRTFDVDRVVAEVRWATERGMQDVHFCDANYGILARDVDIAGRLADMSRASGLPVSVSFSPAKNTTKHLARIFDVLMDADVLVSAGISLQTTDEATLDAVDRRNISTDAYLALAADLRRRGQTLLGDLIIGLPGQSYDSYRQDLQFLMDHEIMARTWSAKLLPNAPMNAPEYRERFGIQVDDDQLVMATTTMTEQDRSRMLRLRNAEIIAERIGVLRHVMRVAQWDHGIEATHLIERVLDVTEAEPQRYPYLAWVFGYFDLLPAQALAWRHFSDDVRRFLADQFDLDPAASDLDTVIRLQQFLLPAPGRRFPATITLAHDYLAYYRSATDSLYTSGQSSPPDRPLREYGPATLRIDGDPIGLCQVGMPFERNTRDEVIQGEFHLFGISAYELDSPLLQMRTVMGGRVTTIDGKARAAARMATIDWDEEADARSRSRLVGDRLKVHRSDGTDDHDVEPSRAVAVALARRGAPEAAP